MTSTSTGWAPGPPPPAPEAPPPDGMSRRSAPSAWTLVVIVLFAIAVDVFSRHRIDGLAGALLVASCSLALLVSGRLRNPQAVALAIAAVPFGGFLAWRTSPWLLPLDALAAVVLIALAASFGRGGSLVSITGSGLIIRCGRAALSVIMAPSYLLGAIGAALPARRPEHRDRWIAIGRGVGLAVPLLIVLGLLLASADAMFGSLFRIPIDPASFTQHLLVIGGGVMVGAYLLAEASSDVMDDVAITQRPLGITEATVVLGGLVALYATFTAVQVVVAWKGDTYVKETVGVTYAEYAREGFFQLLAVAALTWGVLASLRAMTSRSTRAERIRFVVLAELAVVLTLVIVGVAIVRLGLYEQALGLTMLRDASTWAAWWLGAVFVITGVALAGVGERRPWLTFALGASAVLAIVAWNVADPEARVVNRNVARAVATGQLDTYYLTELSDDAVPALVAALPALGPDHQQQVRAVICHRVPPPIGTRRGDRTPRTTSASEPRVGLDANVSAARADEARRGVCTP